MEYGLIGERLPHSFSKEIHEKIADYQYSLKELNPDELECFILEKNYKGLNVTIPYKQAVIPYLDELSDNAASIGAVNTIVNRDGTLYGDNTDFGGMQALFEHASVSVRHQKVLILGTGGTSRTARAVVERLGAALVLRVSRSDREGCITYDEMLARHTDADVIVNTTPVGMYPGLFGCPVDLTRFPSLSGVIDAVYNPLSTPLVTRARAMDIPAEGGLYMLVAQAVLASALFTGDRRDPVGLTNDIYEELLFDKRNIVLIGMPSSGKSTVGQLVAERLGRPFVDTDSMIVERYGEIAALFREKGEAYFRECEHAVIEELAPKTGMVIATGGGAVIRKDNVEAMRLNGALYLLDRPLEHLIPTDDRPLANEKEKLIALYDRRMPLYMDAADYIIDADAAPEQVAQAIIYGE